MGRGGKVYQGVIRRKGNEMKASDIKVGKTYVNCGKGRTKRKVLAIGDEYRPTHWISSPRRNEPGVLYSAVGEYHYENTLYLSSFAAWAGRLDEEGLDAMDVKGW